ncbi:MAG: YqgE/AlgH family protein [Magnetococcales bacterium]|nr:YqgE/AlgH family protein [Magnetococcales bacterium]
MLREQNLAGKFLIAMPGLEDPNFNRAVVFVCAHSAEGALGLVINQPHPATMDDIITQLSLKWTRPDKPIIYHGGPVAPERGFILYEQRLDLPGVLKIAPEIFMATNPAVLHHLAKTATSGRFLFTLGYSGWGNGQLELELRQNAWLVGQVNRQVLFELPPARRWETAIRQMGIDPSQLVEGSGTAN